MTRWRGGPNGWSVIFWRVALSELAKAEEARYAKGALRVTVLKNRMGPKRCRLGQRDTHQKGGRLG